ncbi:MAG TPA: GYDIA family GHMP kinase [Bacteriovoracaceae bacterium]|nr:GYDIA family GHMP kinase [Bacteriovoracaceae bacterium]
MRDQYFYGHGKLLLTGEYFVMEGAQALALPTTVGQSMKVKYRQSYQPVLNWKSFDHTGKIWFESDLEFWHFRPIKESDNEDEKVLFLRDVLKACRLQNPHFLRDDLDIFVETRIEFPLGWGLGSSSTFLYNIAQWAYVSPFELLKKTLGGSGYDIACAQAIGPIIFQNNDHKPQWESCDFNPMFKDQLYFVYLGKKQSSKLEVQKFHKMNIPGKSLIADEISLITKEMISTNDLRTFNKLLVAHEDIIATTLNYQKVKDIHFSDYWGEVKSLGAWGGDFILVTSDRDPKETREYFNNKGFDTLIAYDEIVRSVTQEL